MMNFFFVVLAITIPGWATAAASSSSKINPEQCLYQTINELCGPKGIEFCICLDDSETKGNFESCSDFWKCRPSECICKNGKNISVKEIASNLLEGWDPNDPQDMFNQWMNLYDEEANGSGDMEEMDQGRSDDKGLSQGFDEGRSDGKGLSQGFEQGRNMKGLNN